MNLPRTLTLGVGRNILIFRKQSPHVFFVVGMIGNLASTIMACRATLKLSDTLDEIQMEMHDVKQLRSNVVEHSAVDVYTENKYKKDIAYVYTKAGLKIAKLYGPSVIVGALSVGALTGSHVQMSKRNTALMAAYAAVQKAYEDYRERVRGEVGEESELDLYRGVHTEVVKNEEIKTADPNKLSPYARFFDEYSEAWEKDPELNHLFVQCQQNFANDRLQSKGHVFLNEVYDMLGIERSRAGAVVGWVLGPDGDNYVDFGIYEPRNSKFVNGWEPSILLDFNVDGVIFDKI